MFTGIITDTATVKSHKLKDGILTMTFQKPKDWKDLGLGESVATDGACLTVSATGNDEYDCDLMAETLSKTSFGANIPRRVNLERALQLSDRLSGHFVQGHVDGIGIVVKINQGTDHKISIEFPAEFADLVIYKGSIAINGVSLTVCDVRQNILTVALIPHTLERTTIGSLKIGDAVNLEFDMIGKYISKIIEKRQYDANSK
ncbi:riboflavin synthase subunit alpha [Candidatus Saccharibacteria bacterium RIFCSPHIGHO2_12_FULL_41_12]|nr:MAG: riboflavin synthase subunit alpha [Candidatus Saccharibacteria bacterium RIFCSPHIGHO2_12_FULL_41_12]